MISIPPFSPQQAHLPSAISDGAPLAWLRLGEIKPRGWMLSQMDADLCSGFLGHLDCLVPDIMTDDIYGKDRRRNTSPPRADGSAEDVQVTQLSWWNSETQSNWWDGFIRHAILTQNPEAIERARGYVEEKLATQDSDGYLGIYTADIRYRHRGENGELWAQATLLRGLLAWHEATEDKAALASVERAVNCTMAAFPAPDSEPFAVDAQFAGVNHGLMLVDVLDRLFQLTGKRAYLEYAAFLYRDFNRRPMVEADVQVRNLLDPAYRFRGHAVHTYEHVRALAIAAIGENDPTLLKALEGYVEKLCLVLAPSGGPVGDEWIHGRAADAETIGYEYCSIHELLDSYGVLLQKTAKGVWADAMEWLLYNAGQGARHPLEPSIAYCKTDNSLHMMGSIDGKHTVKEGRVEARFKYSPCHEDVAVCCAPNAGRIYPYAVRTMWMQRAGGIAAVLYGPCVMETEVAGTRVRILQETDYPFSLNVKFHLVLEGARSFPIAFRKPGWALSMHIGYKEVIADADGFVVIKQFWQNGDEISLTFTAEPRVREDSRGQSFVTYGPLVFALPLEGESIPGRHYGHEGFRNLKVAPAQDAGVRWQLPLNPALEVKDSGAVTSGWQRLEIQTNILNPASGVKHEVRLKPMGATILRKVCFEHEPVQNSPQLTA